MIKSFEGCILHPYKDQAGYPTIGFGSRYGLDGKEITMSSPSITMEEAESLLKRDVKKYEDLINKQIVISLNQNQFNALVSFCYNIGSLSGLKDRINKKTIAKEHFLLYCKARDQKTGKLIVLPVLKNRRQKEADLYFS